MDKPNKLYPSAPNSTRQFMPFNIPDHSIREESYEQLLNNRGVRFIHKKALICPNINNIEEGAHKPNCKLCDTNNMVYYGEKEIYGTFQSNSMQKIFEYQGTWEIGQALCTFPADYTDGTVCDLAPFDKLFMPDFEIRIYELINYEVTPDGAQMLRYPVKGVEYMVSARNNVLKPFTQDIDFTITIDGQIKWVAGKEPKINAKTGNGELLSISYVANPVYIVQYPLRELRISQQMEDDFKKYAKRMPMQVLVKRDFLPQFQEAIKK